jgi:hypothetical protein
METVQASPVTSSYPIYTWVDVKEKCREADNVAIVGFASSTRDQAPFGDKDWEIWTLNDLGRQLPRWTRLFDTHSKEHLIGGKWDREGKVVHGKEHWTYMSACPPPGDSKFNPIFMLQHYDEIPASVALPVDEMAKQLYTIGQGKYFTCGPAYMMAMAICEGYKAISLFGIDLLLEKEYNYERPCMEHLIGIAVGKGIDVYIPRQSALCKAGYVYGFGYPKASKETKKLSDFIAGTQTAISTLDDVTKFLKEHLNGPKSKSEIEQEWMKFYQNNRSTIASKQVQIAQQLGVAQGTLQTMDSVEIWCQHLDRGGELKA